MLKNPRRPDLEVVVTSALADSGSVYLCIPERVYHQLQLEVLESKVICLADGSQKWVPYAGPVEVRFKNRAGFTGALVMGDEVLLGLIPMEDMDLVILPKTQMLDVNPDSPNFGTAIAKGMRHPSSPRPT